MLRLIQAYGLATAAQPLAALLPSLSTEERGEVLRTIAALKNPESESLMAAALRDPDGRVRMAAARYFRARPTATVAADLIRLLDDEEVRESAADALAALRWRPALPVLLRLVQEDPGRVEALADALAATSDPAALQLLASHLRGGDFPSVNPIANSFAKADERALPLLLKTLRAPDPSVRQGAAEALGALRHPGGVPGLIERLQDSDSQEVREAAAHALGEIGDPAAIRPLIAATWTEYHHSLVFESMVALGKLKAREAVPALVSRIGYIRWMLEDPAGEALIEIGPPAVPALIRVLEERGEGASVAARALAFIGDRRAAPALRRALPYPAYTEMCAQGLGKMRDRSALHLLGPLATHPSKGVRIAARRAVARICWDVPASAE
jgi:HEAT repeat protein